MDYGRYRLVNDFVWFVICIGCIGLGVLLDSWIIVFVFFGLIVLGLFAHDFCLGRVV